MHEHHPQDEDDDELQADELEAEIMRADQPFGSEAFGTTAEEALAGEPLDRALAREQRERPATEKALSVLDEGVFDMEGELVGDAVIARNEFASPEEAALSVRDSAPGATDHVDPRRG